MARRQKAADVVVIEGDPDGDTDAKLCECGYGELVQGKIRFRPGHDARLKARLLTAFDAGDEAAKAELVERGWRTEAQLAARADKGGDAETRRQAGIAAKVERINVKIAALVEQREALTRSLERASRARPNGPRSTAELAQTARRATHRSIHSLRLAGPTAPSAATTW